MSGTDWFERLLAEYDGKHAAMFAFSNKQVAVKFQEWGEPIPEFPLQGWTSLGVGLIVRSDVADEFVRRMESDGDEYRNSLPAVTVRSVGVDYWDRARYRVVSADEGAPVTVGQIVVDASLREPGEAVEVHGITEQGEPIAALPVRVVHEVGP